MQELIDKKYLSWVAIIPGWFLGDFIGAISSFLLVRELVSDEDKDNTFELALLRISSLLIKSDGNISKSEINTVQKYFERAFGYNKSVKLFKEVKSSYLTNYDIYQLIGILKTKIDSNKYYSIIQFLYSIAASDGNISKAEDDFIFLVGGELGFTKLRINSIRSQFVKVKSKSKSYDSKTVQYLNVLGLKAGVDKSEIKNAYRTLAKEFHPDKLTGMSDGIKKLAEEKFQVIQEAYEYLNKNCE